MSQDVVADGLNQIMNAKKARKKEVVLTRHSKLLISVLALAKLKSYIKDYSLDSGKLQVEFGKLNECKAIKPRYTITINEIEKYQRRYLPAKDFGILIISSSKGLITDQTAKEKNIGGCLIAYIY